MQKLFNKAFSTFCKIFLSYGDIISHGNPHFYLHPLKYFELSGRWT